MLGYNLAWLFLIRGVLHSLGHFLLLNCTISCFSNTAGQPPFYVSGLCSHTLGECVGNNLTPYAPINN